MLQKTLINFIWALPYGSGFTLQVLARSTRCGLYATIPNTENIVKYSKYEFQKYSFSSFCPEASGLFQSLLRNLFGDLT